MATAPNAIPRRLRDLIIKDVPVMHKKDIATKYNIHPNTVTNLVKKFKSKGMTDPDPWHPGRKRKISNTKTKRIVTLLQAKPFLTNEQIKTKLKLPVSPQTIGRQLKRISPPIMSKVIQFDDPDTFNQKWKDEGKQFQKRVRQIPLKNRIYIDESYIHQNISKATGRSLRGSRIVQKRNRYAQKLTILSAVRQSGVIHPSVIFTKNMTHEQFEEYVKSHIVPKVKSGDVILWDRLGQAGRKKNPDKFHYSQGA